MDFCLALALACQPHQLPVVADYLRGTGRRGWIQRLELRRRPLPGDRSTGGAW